MTDVVPLFPLSHVLLPGMPLPLHIFEQRYRDLISDVTDAPATGAFGVVALRTGTEAVTAHTTEHGPDVESIGTLAEIIELQPNPNGTFELLAVGSRRFRIRELLVPDDDTGAAYLRGEVDFLDELDGELTPDGSARARELFEVYDAILRRLANRDEGDELPDDANLMSYDIAARLPLPPAERQALLADPTAAERLQRVARLLRREIALLQRTRSIAVSPAVLRMVTGIN